MVKFSLRALVRALLLVFAFGALSSAILPDAAQARAGGGRSVGRPSGGGGQRTSPPPVSRQQPGVAPNNSPNPPLGAPSNGGGFMRSMAGGIAGGFLGSMLFGSLGNASGYGGGGGGGGIGILEMALFAGLAFFAFRWWKNRLQPATPFISNRTERSPSTAAHPFEPRLVGGTSVQPVGIDPEEASDLFFKVQGAWTRRDLSSVASQLGAEVGDVLRRDLEDLKRNGRINRLENITVRRTDVTNSWSEGAQEFSTVRFLANLLDYTVDATTGSVVEGSDSVPVKFEEDWTFSRSAGAGPWQLAGIQQMT